MTRTQLSTAIALGIVGLFVLTPLSVADVYSWARSGAHHLYSLVQSGQADALDEPARIATVDHIVAAECSNADVQRAAVYALAETLEADGDIAPLATIVRNSTCEEVQKAALYAIGDVGGAGARSLLTETATGHANVEIAKAAVYALEDVIGGDDVSAYVSILESARSVEVKKAVLYQIGDSESPAAVQALAGVARNGATTDLRRAATYALGEIGTDEARRVLVDLVSGN